MASASKGGPLRIAKIEHQQIPSQSRAGPKPERATSPGRSTKKEILYAQIRRRKQKNWRSRENI
jgi:hypothetical protein